MPDFSVRSKEEEIMDDLTIDNEGLRRTLDELDFINSWLGGNSITYSAVRSLIASQAEKANLTIVDVGCGSGDLIRRLNKKVFRGRNDIKYIGIDANPAVINKAKAHRYNTPNMEFEVMDVLSKKFDQLEADIYICTLFLHHFEDKQLLKLLETMRGNARIGLVINDLHRHPVAYYSISLLTSLFSRSYMTKYDAKLSVARSFKRKELFSLLKESGWNHTNIKWRWAFRWKVFALSN